MPWRALLAISLLVPAFSATAQEARIGYAASITTVDPHYNALTNHVAIHQHIFEALVGEDEQLRPRPELAAGWRAIDATTWEFSLRPNAHWHDGRAFTAEDVPFSISRAQSLPNSQTPLTIYTQGIRGVEIVDAATLRVTTDGPRPLLPAQLVAILLVPRHLGDATTADFNTGRNAIGTGPYRFHAWQPGARFEMTRNPGYDGAPEPWEKVTFLSITNTAARVAALRAGDVDLIDQVPTDDAVAMGQDSSMSVFTIPGVRNVYLYVDIASKVAPGITALDGKPIGNPLRDVRVRRALSLAIHRAGIVRSVMNGQAVASGQLLPKGSVGHDPSLLPDPFDVRQARHLLAEAGFPDGFAITLAGPNDRYVNGERVLQAVAQGWTRAGLRVRVEALPGASFFPRSARSEFSVGMLGWGTSSGEADSPLQALVATRDRSSGWGTFNRSGYGNPDVDALLRQAARTGEMEGRASLYRAATRIAMEEVALIPLHHQVNIWAARRGFVYTPRNDERTMATGLHRMPD
jgi:peptide/nickel transport system substrate-binding protein